MNNRICKILVMIVMTPLLAVSLILYIPYALCKGLVNRGIFNDYIDLWGDFYNFLLYPITYVGKWRTRCNALKVKLQYYKDRCEELGNELDKMEQRNKQMRQD